MKLIPKILLAAAFLAGHAHAAWPDKPIKLVVPYSPGGAADALARTVATELGQRLKQQVIVDNRPGAGGTIGAQAVATAPADGYTFLYDATSFAVNPSLYPKLPFDYARDFLPVSMVARIPTLLVVPAASPFNSMKDLLAQAKAKPGSLSYASTGIGSSNHLSMEKFKQMAGVDITHVPYKGSAPAVTDLIGGQINVMFDNISNVLPHVKSGKLRALAVTTPARSPLAPEVPTVIEAGVPGYELGVWFGIAAPGGTPRPIVDKLNAEIVKILRMPDVKEKFAAQGVEAIGSTVEQFQAHLQAQRTMWAKVVKDAGVTPE